MNFDLWLQVMKQKKGEIYNYKDANKMFYREPEKYSDTVKAPVFGTLNSAISNFQT